MLDALSRHHADPHEPARALAMGSNHVTMVLDGLQARGLVERLPHPHDRRRRRVHATEQGRGLAGAIGREVGGLEERLMAAALSPQERRALEELAARVRRVLGEVVVHETRARPGP